MVGSETSRYFLLHQNHQFRYMHSHSRALLGHLYPHPSSSSALLALQLRHLRNSIFISASLALPSPFLGLYIVVWTEICTKGNVLPMCSLVSQLTLQSAGTRNPRGPISTTRKLTTYQSQEECLYILFNPLKDESC